MIFEEIRLIEQRFLDILGPWTLQPDLLESWTSEG
jgi:hypothetical protein